MILITGASGFVGYQLVCTLIKQNYKVRCLVRGGTSKIDLLGKEIEIVKGDIRDIDEVNNAVKGVRYVVHLAGMIQSHDAEIVKQVNIEGTKNIVNACLKYNIEKFVFFSTLNVTLPVKNEYSRSKLECEDIVKKSGLNFTILKPSIIYGKGDNGTIGKYIKSVKKQKKIYLLGSGDYKIQPIYVCDVVQSVCELLNDASKFKNETLFLVGNDVVTYNELVNLISDTCGVKCQKSFIPIMVVNGIVKLFAKFSKKCKQFEDKLKTYQFDKVVDERLREDIFPVQTTSLRNGIAESIKHYESPG